MTVQLPGLVDEDPEERRWMALAACKGISNTEADRFFTTVPVEQVEVVKDYCRDCPVSNECLEYAIARPTACEAGIWGGLTQQQRERLRRRMSRGKRGWAEARRTALMDSPMRPRVASER